MRLRRNLQAAFRAVTADDMEDLPHLADLAHRVVAAVEQVQKGVDALGNYGEEDDVRPYFGRKLSSALSSGGSDALRRFVGAVLGKLLHYNEAVAERTALVDAVVEVVNLLNDYRSSDPERACNNTWVAWLADMLGTYTVQDKARTALVDALFNHLDMSEEYLKKYLPTFGNLADYYASQLPPDVKQTLLSVHLDEGVKSDNDLLNLLTFPE